MRNCGLASLAIYYYDFREDQKKDLRGLLSSILLQLCDQFDSYYDVLSTFYSVHCDGAQCPSNDELAQCLRTLIGSPRTSSSLSGCRSFGRMSKHLRAELYQVGCKHEQEHAKMETGAQAACD
jgi:hypothetical protein